MQTPAQPSSAQPRTLSHEQYRRLAEFRFYLRRFLHFSKEAAESAGIHAQQYQLLQVVAGMPEDEQPTIAAVAHRMCLRHNSAVELVSRTIEQGLLRKVADPLDHRRLVLHTTAAGEHLLASLVTYHLHELEDLGPDLIKSLRKVLALREPAVGRELDPAKDPEASAAPTTHHDAAGERPRRSPGAKVR